MKKRGRPRKVLKKEVSKVFNKKIVKDESILVYTSEEKTNEEQEPQYRFYLKCPFCQNIFYEHTGRDLQSSWCPNCGKCVPLDWKKEFVTT